jgi:hypothetical protein
VKEKDTQVRFRARGETLGSSSVSLVPPRAELPEALPEAEGRETVVVDEPLGEPLVIGEVARLIGVSVWTVRQQCLRQGLPHFRASRSGRLIFYRNQVVRWLIEKQRKEVVNSVAL